MIGDVGVIKILETVEPVLHRMIIQMPVIQIIANRVTVTEHINVLIRRKVNDLHIRALAFCKPFRENHAVYHVF